MFNFLKAWNLDQLVEKTVNEKFQERGRERCKNFRIKYLPSKGRYLFLVRGYESWSDPKGHIVSVKFEYDEKTRLTRPSEIDVRVGCSCLTGDTSIPLLDGRTLTLEQIHEEFGTDKPFWVYSVNKDGSFKPGLAKSLGVTKEVTELCRITLDNGRTIKCTPDHLFMARDGSWIEAGKLIPGQSLMPLYFKDKKLKKGASYLQVKDNKTRSWNLVHRQVAKSVFSNTFRNLRPLSETNDFIVVHNRNFNHRDNTPENLQIMSSLDHNKYHNCLKNKESIKEGVRKAWADPEKRKKMTESNRRAGRIRAQKYPDQVADFLKKSREWNQSEDSKKVRSAITKKNWEEGKYKTEIYSQIKRRDRESLSKKIKKFYKSEKGKLCIEDSRNKLVVVNKTTPNGMKRPGIKTWSRLAKILGICFKLEKSGIQLTPENFYRVGGYATRALNGFIPWEVLQKFYEMAKKKAIDGEYRGMYPEDKKEALEYCQKIEPCVNHKVVSNIRVQVKPTKVYDISVQEHENFLLSAGVIVHNCPAFQYWGSAFNSTENDYNLEDRVEDRPPDIRDPLRQNWLCKHLISVRVKTLNTIKIRQLEQRYKEFEKKHVEEEEHIRKPVPTKMPKQTPRRKKTELPEGWVPRKKRPSEIRSFVETSSFEEFALASTWFDSPEISIAETIPTIEGYLLRHGFKEEDVREVISKLTYDNYEDKLVELGLVVQ